MSEKTDLQKDVLFAAAQNGINSILFRNALSRKLKLNVTESMCLSLLGIKGICTPKELSHYTGLTTGSTTAMLDRLEQRGFIKRKPNPDDRRGVFIEIDNEYARNAAQLVTGIQKAHHELISTYADKDLKVIADFLTKFTENIITHTKQIEDSVD